MASQTKSIHQRVDRGDRHRATTRSDHEGAEHPIPIPSGFCGVCNLTFGIQEKRVFWGEKVAHPRCVSRLRRSNAA